MSVSIKPEARTAPRPGITKAIEKLFHGNTRRAAHTLGVVSPGVLLNYIHGRSGYTVESHEKLGNLLCELADYAARAGFERAEFEPWAVCPGEFARPKSVEVAA